MKLNVLAGFTVFIFCMLLATPGTAAEKESDAPEASTSPAAAAEPGKVYEATDVEALGQVIGSPVVVEGVILKTGESKSGKVKYLNFTEDFWKGLALVFFADKSTFPMETLDSYVGKKVRVSGTLSEHQAHVQIVIEEPSQIEVLAEGDPAAESPEVPQSQPDEAAEE